MMFTILTVIFLLSALFYSLDEHRKSARLCLILAFCTLAAGFHQTFTIENMSYEREDTPYMTHEILALSDGTMASGRIYLRSGYFEEKYGYLYGYKTTNGGMKTQKVDGAIAEVFFSDDIVPCAKWYKESRSYLLRSDVRYTCDIFIPTDSLAADYSIDLE